MPDKTHIHHQLLAFGMTKRLAMPTIVIASFAFTLLNYHFCRYIDITILFAFDLIIWIVTNMILSRSIRSPERQEGIILKLSDEFGKQAFECGVKVIGQSGVRTRCLNDRTFDCRQPAEALFGLKLAHRTASATSLTYQLEFR